MPRLTQPLAAVLVATCGPPHASLPPDQVVAFGARERDAATSIVIHADGRAVGVVHWPDEPQEEHRAVLTADQLDALQRDLDDRRCCRLKSKRVYPYDDEPRVTLSIRWNELDCEIAMWAEEWTERADAKACRDAVQRFVPPRS